MFSSLVGASGALSTPLFRRSIVAPGPIVNLGYGSFQGFSSSAATESFLGIPFAQPPVGDLRFRQPVAPEANFSTVQQATAFGNACPQQVSLAPNTSLPDTPLLDGVPEALAELMPKSNTTQSEDCLYLNVIRPTNTSAGADLPVVVWIYGGAFETGDASAYDGTPIVARSSALGSDVLYVSLNYRINGFGFLAGEEVRNAGVANLGLYDQRLALRWVQDNIRQFGGDPEKVIAWGQSAGSISLWLHMVAFDGELNGLFRGAVMESGFTQPLDFIEASEPTYQHMVAATNCSSTNGVNSTLDCLRAAPYEALLDAINTTPPLLSFQSLNTTWRPTVDGVMLKKTMRDSMKAGMYAKIPIIAGDVEDEGTLFSMLNVNITTDDQFTEYIASNYIPTANSTQIAQVTELYSSNPDVGSPFGTGSNFALSPQYKRIAAFQGDYFFHAPRRFALSIASKTQDVWSYLYRAENFTGLGTFHETDLQEFFELTPNSTFAGTDALVNFAYNLNPNIPAVGYKTNASPASRLQDLVWPNYNASSSGSLLTFQEGGLLNVTQDDFRGEAIQCLNDLQDILML